MAKKKESRAARRRRVMRNRAIALGVLIIIIIVVIILIASCSKNKNSSTAANTSQAQEAVTAEDGVVTDEEALEEETSGEEETTTAAEVKNEKPINLYTMDYNTMTCKKVTHISKPWTPSEDLEAFGAFFSEEDSFPFTSETQAHKDTWNSVDTKENYKIGYELSFDVDTDHKVITILEPADIENNPDLYNGDYREDGDYSDITGYMGVWVYDDMHQEEGVGYAHIKQSEMKDDTLLTSIKLRPTPQSDEIDNLVLKGFSYSSDDEFDAEGHYAGKYAATVTIDRN